MAQQNARLDRKAKTGEVFPTPICNGKLAPNRKLVNARHVMSKTARWTKAYIGLIKERQLSPGARLTLILLRSYCPTNRTTCFPSLRSLQKDIGCSRRSLLRWLDELAEQKWLRREPRYRKNGAQSSTEYRLFDERKSMVKEAFSAIPPSAKFATGVVLSEKPSKKYSLSHREKRPMKRRKIIPYPSSKFGTP